MQEIKAALEKAGFSVAYHHWEQPPPPPYTVYYEDESANFGADNRVYEKINDYVVELYTNKKDKAAEQRIEDALDNAEIYWDKTGGYIDTEKLYMTTYYVRK